jgi:aminopeptidase N
MHQEHEHAARCACAAHKLGAADGFTLPGAERHYPPDLELEPVHLDIDLALDLEAVAAHGRVTHTLRARRDGAQRLRLDAVALQDLVVADPAGGALDWDYDGERIEVRWRQPFALGEERRLTVAYRVQEPTAGLYFSRPTEAYPNQPWFVATDHETERARHWLPCVDLPSARTTLDFHLRAESRLTILANGALLSQEEHDDGSKTAHWQLDFPCPSYLVCFAIGDFVSVDDGEVDGIPVAYHACAPFTAEDLKRSFGRTPGMLAWMTTKLDMAFPFPKYHQIALPGIGGAMENISLVTWDDSFVLDTTLATELSRVVDEVNLHEMAHSYFGDAVVCRDFAHAWLKESWAVYMEQVWFGETLGEDERAYQFWRDAKAYLQEADERYQRPIVTREFNSSWQMYDRHLYPGGACRLHTLCCELGEETFWQGVRSYLARYRGQVVETDDFRRVLEEVSGRSLGRFFDQWFLSPGYPAIKVRFKHDAARGEGRFTIEQTQADAHTGERAFQLRTELGWVADGQLRLWPVTLEGARQTVIIPMAAPPEQVRFDPRGRILHKLDLDPGETLLRRQLTAAGDVTGRIQAGLVLAAKGSREGIAAIRTACQAEPFWGVRVEWMEALGKAGVDAALETLVERCLLEQDPRVLASVMRAIGRYRDPLVLEAVQARLDLDDLPYQAHAAALEALGAGRDEAPVDLLLEAAGREGFGGIVQAGAFRALAASRLPEALTALEEYVGYGASSNRSRPAAVSALADLGHRQERGARERVTDTLVDLLRDPNRRVAWTAARGLGVMEATSALPALEAFGAPFCRQEQVAVARITADIRAAASAKPGGKDDALDSLRNQLRKLMDRVEKLEARLGAPGTVEDDGAKEASN